MKKEGLKKLWIGIVFMLFAVAFVPAADMIIDNEHNRTDMWGYDGTTYRPLKVDTLGRLEMVQITGSNWTDARLEELLNSSCTGTDKVTGILYDGNVTCGEDLIGAGNGNCTIDGSCPLITYDSELTYIGNCSGKNCDIGWGNLTSVPAGFADGVDNIGGFINGTDISVGYIESENWSNITITESQISDLSHTVDTTIGNCSVNNSCPNIVYGGEIIDCENINFSGTIGAAGICDGSDDGGTGGNINGTDINISTLIVTGNTYLNDDIFISEDKDLGGTTSYFTFDNGGGRIIARFNAMDFTDYGTGQSMRLADMGTDNWQFQQADYSFSNALGIGVISPQSQLDVEGGVAIGATYSGTTTAPANGAIIEGNVGIGNNNPNYKLDVDGIINGSQLKGILDCNDINFSGTIGAASICDGDDAAGAGGDINGTDINISTLIVTGNTYLNNDIFIGEDKDLGGTTSYFTFDNGGGRIIARFNAMDFTDYGTGQSMRLADMGTDNWQFQQADYSFSNALGIGVITPQSKLDVEGGVAIGATYSGTTAAPTDGAIIEGNVGIGTTNPQRYLHVNSGTIDVAARFESSDTGSLIEIKDNGGTSYIGTKSGQTFLGPSASSADPTNLNIDTNGNVGIGTITPSNKLDVVGNINITGNITTECIIFKSGGSICSG